MKAIIFSGLFLFTSASFSQTTEGQLLENNRPSVMIIPFNDFYYLSDADPEIARANKKQAKEVSAMFRYGITNNVASRVITSYDTYNILTDTTLQSKEDLNRIYSSIVYKYQKPIDITQPQNDSKEIYKSDIFGFGNSEANAKSKNEKVKEEDIETKEYMNAVVKDASLFTYLQNQYNVNLFVFINQFEMKTNWESCLDLATQNFEREVIVHYSIYDAKGTQLKGDAVSIVFPSNENSFDQIIGEQFPLIAEQLGVALQQSATAENSK